MKNEKVIVVSGFAHGGTNILWNILQSHPCIVAPLYETGEIFKRSPILRPLTFKRMWKRIPLSSQTIDYILYRYKMESYHHPDNRYISDGILYSRKQMIKTALCLKSINDDILFTELLAHIYPDMYFIGLVRDGHSLADGYVRRGRTATEAGCLYYRITKEIQRYASFIPNFVIVKFEDILQNPFQIAEGLYEFLGVQPYKLEKLRFKSKKVISGTGKHNVSFGTEHRKYWFSRENIGGILDPNIEQKQSARLSKENIEAFNKEAGIGPEFFGYASYQ